MELNPKFLWDYTLRAQDLEDEQIKRWYLARVLSRGGLEDIRAVGLATIRHYLPTLRLPRSIRRFWEFYFSLTAPNA